MNRCADGKFRGGCPTCDEPDGGSWSYREYDTTWGTPAYHAWEAWMRHHNIPVFQVPYKGWAARDAVRKTVSVLLLDWDPADETHSEFGSGKSFIHHDLTDEGHLNSSKDVRRRVFTVELDFVPLPFPEVNSPAPTDAEKEILVKLDRVLELLSDPLDFIRGALDRAVEQPADVAVSVQPAVEFDG